MTSSSEEPLSAWRFTASKVEDGWIVQDLHYRSANTDKITPRTVCICGNQEETRAIAAFMNGDLEGGRQIHSGFLSFLKSSAKS